MEESDDDEQDPIKQEMLCETVADVDPSTTKGGTTERVVQVTQQEQTLAKHAKCQELKQIQTHIVIKASWRIHVTMAIHILYNIPAKLCLHLAKSVPLATIPKPLSSKIWVSKSACTFHCALVQIIGKILHI